MPYYCFEAEPKSNQCLHFLSSTYELWESSIFLSKRERLSNEFVFLLIVEVCMWRCMLFSKVSHLKNKKQKNTASHLFP